jgi:hypothetical protein
MKIPEYYLIILRYLYEHRNEPTFYSFNEIFEIRTNEEQQKRIVDVDDKELPHLKHQHQDYIHTIFQELADIKYIYACTNKTKLILSIKKIKATKNFRISLKGIAYYESYLANSLKVQ